MLRAFSNGKWNNQIYWEQKNLRLPSALRFFCFIIIKTIATALPKGSAPVVPALHLQ